MPSENRPSRVPNGPAALDEHRQDPVEGALREAELAGDVGEAELRSRREEVEHRERRVDACGRGLPPGGSRPRGLGDLLGRDTSER